MSLSDPGIRERALSLVFDTSARVTPRAFIRALINGLDLSRSRAKAMLRQLVEEKELCYNHDLGTTFVEQSFLKPVPVSPHFILVPASHTLDPAPPMLPVRLTQGIAFGGGRHPTTRLCLKALDHCLFEKNRFPDRADRVTADIGSGSGVLAIAMVRAGFGDCMAYELDPASAAEARKNVGENHLSDRIRVETAEAPVRKKAWSLVCANLRLPTLKSLCGLMAASLTPDGALVLSGIRPWEKTDLETAFRRLGFVPAWQTDEKEWSAFVMIRER